MGYSTVSMIRPFRMGWYYIICVGLATGQPKLNEVIREFVGKVFQPAYKNWTTLVHTGNTDAWFKTVQTILNPGEGLIVSEWTYPSAMAVSIMNDDLLYCVKIFPTECPTFRYNPCSSWHG